MIHENSITRTMKVKNKKATQGEYLSATRSGRDPQGMATYIYLM
jgi:hypothetical protein